MNIEAIYTILVNVARHRGQMTYLELSNAYQDSTGDWHEPHGSWDEPLGEINVAMHEAGLPPLSAVVVLGSTREPGGLFWGSGPNVPARPRDEVSRIGLYGQLLGRVHETTWPAAFPG